MRVTNSAVRDPDMHSFFNILSENPLLLLFVVIGIGYLIGNIRLFGFSFGVAAVLFVGMAMGAVDPRLTLPEYIYIIGLVLFVYAIGLQAGPGFFSSFRKRGLKVNLAAIYILAVGAGVAVLVWFITDLSAPAVAGLFCGSLTNTPALAATVETVKSLSTNLPADAAQVLAASPVVSYGLAYPFGVLGVILWMYLFSRHFKVDFAKEEADRLRQLGSESIRSVTYKVTNPNVVGKKVSRVLATFGHTGFVLSRMKTGDRIEVVSPDTILSLGDSVVAVGSDRGQEIARILFGEQAEEHIAERHEELSYRRVFVSNKEVIGKTIFELQFHKTFAATITRIRRGDVEFVPSPETILERGDRLLVVAQRSQSDQVARYFGDSLKSISEADFLSLSLGIVLGVFLGMIPIPLPGGLTFKLGFAGGPLVVGLIVGRLERTGPIIWGMPFAANLALRQLGLVFFLAAIGTRAGVSFGATFHQGGWITIAAGALITTLVAILAILVGYRYLKLPMGGVMGVISGMQTQPACLAFANQQTQNELPNVWYATVYPASMITKIILAQIIVSTLMLLSR
jgi:putative transport protein